MVSLDGTSKLKFIFQSLQFELLRVIEKLKFFKNGILRYIFCAMQEYARHAQLRTYTPWYKVDSIAWMFVIEKMTLNNEYNVLMCSLLRKQKLYSTVKK